MAAAAAGKKKLEFYKVLGVPKGAGDAQIKSAYRKLAIQYHPDKTAGDEELEQKFKEVSAAYSVLSDPAKRRQYDSMGDVAVDLEALDMEQMTFGTTLLAALFSRLGAPIPTAIPQRTLDLAQDPMSRTQGERITWGTRVEGRIQTHGVQMYFGEISEEEAKAGVRIYANSSAGSKFKLLWFAPSGGLLSQEESQPELFGRGGTSACITLAAFGAMSVDAAHTAWRVSDEDDPPPVFRRLETLSSSKYSPARAGEVLVAVQGDNFFRDVKYTISFSLCKPNAKESIVAVEECLAEKQSSLAKLEQEYWDAKERYEKILFRIEQETDQVDAKLLEREALYASMAGDDVMEGGAIQALRKKEEARAKAQAKKEQKEAARA